MTHLLEVENLSVRFRTTAPLRALIERNPDPFIDAVCDVSFNLEEGETYALVGESGSGKTTLARAIIGLNPASSGSIRFEGEEIGGRSDRAMHAVRQRMAMMFQDPVGSLSPRQTVRNLITEPFRIHKVPLGDPDAEARRLLDLVGLAPEFADRYPHQLSGGQARRVGVARALALRPRLILADEPTAGLDVSVQGEILNVLARLQRELNLTILIITHNLNVVRHISDRMAIMYLGRFVETGPTEYIFRTPRHPYTEALLSANPTPDPQDRRKRIVLSGEIPSLMNRPSGCEFHTRCPYARDLCKSTVPAFDAEELEGGLRRYSCHFPLSDSEHARKTAALADQS